MALFSRKPKNAYAGTELAGSKPKHGIYKRKTSRSAVLCQVLGFWSLVILLCAMFLFRREVFDARTFFIALGLVCTLAFFALFAAVPAIRDFLEEDALGAGAAIRGILFAAMVLVPFGYYGYQAIVLPKLNDVSTDLIDLPQFNAVLAERRGTSFPNGNSSLENQQLQADNYPSIGPHRYSTNALRVAEAVSEIIARRGWDLKAEPTISEPSSDEAERANEKPSDDAQGDTADEQPEDVVEPEAILYFEAVHRSLLLRAGTDIAIRLTNDGGETIVDIRSASRHTAHDFGTNAVLISSFLAELDVALLGVAGEGVVLDEGES